VISVTTKLTGKAIVSHDDNRAGFKSFFEHHGAIATVSDIHLGLDAGIGRNLPEFFG